MVWRGQSLIVIPDPLIDLLFNLVNFLEVLLNDRFSSIFQQSNQSAIISSKSDVSYSDLAQATINKAILLL